MLRCIPKRERVTSARKTQLREHTSYKTNEVSSQGTPRKNGWVCVTRFPKPLLYL